MSDDYVPLWACSRFGGIEHDWLDCPECQERYERYLESLYADVATLGEVHRILEANEEGD